MTKEDIFVSIGYVEKKYPLKLSPVRRYFMRIHDSDMSEIMRYLHKKQVKFDKRKVLD